MTPASEHDESTVTSSQTVPQPKQLLRTMASTEDIDSTINHPGSVKINVKGAFIVDPDTATPASAVGGVNGRMSPIHPETSDIRLPNHTAVVSHIAIDVGFQPLLP